MFSDECEFAARPEGEWCNHTRQENANFRTRNVRQTAFYTRSDITNFTYLDIVSQI